MRYLSQKLKKIIEADFKPPSQMHLEAFHHYYNVFGKAKKDIENILNKSIEDINVLVLGAGYRYGEVICWHNFCRNAVGIEILENYYRDGFYKEFKTLAVSSNPLLAFFKALNYRTFLPYYYEKLESLLGSKIVHPEYNLMKYDGESLPFENNTFDLVISNAVTEHVRDMDQFLGESRRVLRKGGISYHVHHNYFSLSGAHMGMNLQKENPWGHLRGKFPPQSYCFSDGLNRLSKDQLLSSLIKNFPLGFMIGLDKNHNKFGTPEFEFEGEKYLSKNLAVDLNMFKEEDLLTRSFLLLGKK